MNKLVKLTILSGLFLTIEGICIENKLQNTNQLPQLHQEPHHETVIKRITTRFLNYHYRQFNLDSVFSSQIFTRYLNMIDYSHNLLLSSDIDHFIDKKTIIGKELQSGKLEIFYSLFNLAQKRCFERYQYALSLLEKPMIFTTNDSITLDRTKEQWPTSESELNKLWDSKVKFEQLNLKLIGKTDREITNMLKKRYHLVLKRIKNSNSEDVFRLIANAFAREIDPHTSYLSPHNTEQFNTEISLYLEGIGIVLQMDDDDHILINSVVSGSPAERSKSIVIGDRILGIAQGNNPIIDVFGCRLDDVVSLIKGPIGTKVRLEILPETKGRKHKTVTLIRERIRLVDRAVKVSIKTFNKKQVAVFYIPSFYIGLTKDIKVQLEKISTKNIQTIVIDLRGNGGGALNEAVSLAGLFIPSGPIVQIGDKNGKISQDSDTNNCMDYTGPLIILLDRYSASASEIFAAALQDYQRAVIVGETSFGKGTVQQYHSLNRIYDSLFWPEWPKFGSVQYTIQKFYRVTGGSTQRKGVKPDIFMIPIRVSEETGESLKENSLDWDNIPAATYSKMNDLQPLIINLNREHTARIMVNTAFQNIKQEIARYRLLKDKKKIISLNYAQRLKEDYGKNYDSIILNHLNENFTYQGKQPVKSFTDFTKDYQASDPYLDESILIAIDFAYFSKRNINNTDMKK